MAEKAKDISLACTFVKTALEHSSNVTAQQPGQALLYSRMAHSRWSQPHVVQRQLRSTVCCSAWGWRL